MYYIVETEQNYEAAVALCNKIVRELNKGVVIVKEDLLEYKAIAERVIAINKDIHKSVQDVENRRFGGNKSICEMLLNLIEERLSTAPEPNKIDFEKMTKQELIDYIKSNSSQEKSKEETLTLINPEEVEKEKEA